jgi:hypothetical protein
MYTSDKFIMIKTSFRGFHCWPEASQFAGEEVKFLETSHRHTFHVKVELEVSHPDRAVEFFVLQKRVDDIIASLWPLSPMGYLLGRRSCETMCEEIIAALRSQQINDAITIEIWEDNEVGGRVKSYMKPV